MRRMCSRLAIAVVLAIGLLPATLQAQEQQSRKGRQAQAQPAQPALKLSKEELAALTPVETALTAKDFATAKTALAAAQPAIQGPDAKFMYDNFQFRVGQGTNDNQMVVAGLEGMVASGKLQPANLPGVYKALANAQANIGQHDKADATLAQYLKDNPNDADAYIIQAQGRIGQKKIAEALQSIDRAISIQKAAGQTVPESWYRVAARNASAARLGPQAAKAGRDWVSAYPKPETWREVLTNMREATADRELELDVYRAQRVTRSLVGEGDFVEFTRALSNGGYPGEIRSVLDEAAAAKSIDAASPRFSQLIASVKTRAAADRPTLPGEEKKALSAASGTPLVGVGNAYFGYGDYAKAIELYRAALKKGSVDANVVNTRLGLALALSGQKAEAEAAFKSISGPRSDLAGYLLIWLAQRA